MPIKILAVFSAPIGYERLNIRLEKDCLIKALKNYDNGYLFDVTSELHITLKKFQEFLNKDNFQLIHFSGHSDQKYIIFEQENGSSEKIPLDAFVELIKEKKKEPNSKLKCIIFNSCSSFELGEKISKLGICTISMRNKIKEKASQLFTEGFYNALNRERTISEMLEIAKNNIHIRNFNDYKFPELKGNGTIKFEIIDIPFVPEELKYCIEDERDPDFERVNEVFVNPKDYVNTLNILKNKRFLIIIGPPNVGKTSTAYKLANTIKQDCKNIGLIYSIRDIPEGILKKIKNSIVIFDDIFGKVDFDDKVQANIFKEIFDLTHPRNNNYVICTSREEILLKAKSSRTSFSELPDLDDFIFKIEQEGFYDNDALKKILKNHLTYYLKQNIISKREVEIAENNETEIISNLRFPHNYKELVEKELLNISNKKIDIKEAIKNAKYIKRAVKSWFLKMEDKSLKYFIFTLALFQGLNKNEKEFHKIYLRVIELLKKRYTEFIINSM